jgi:hypothetical protein
MHVHHTQASVVGRLKLVHSVLRGDALDALGTLFKQVQNNDRERLDLPERNKQIAGLSGPR